MSRFKYFINGIVQGVGFRPFIYKIANKLNLAGFVKNSSNGVIIEIEGDKKNIEQFELLLKLDLPPLAKISLIEKRELKPLYQREFKIVHSEISLYKTASISPDIAICINCKKDIIKFSKYKEYFATNCTNCGPRYTIIQTPPYDRINTSMGKFKLCKSCQKEFKNPTNRRYHAQAISCKYCGPKLDLRVKDLGFRKRDNIYKNVSNLIKQGYIGAIKAIGGFHIVCDATNEEVVKKLRIYKNRPSKPFAVMFKDLEQIKAIAKLSDKEKELLQSKEAPIVLLDKKKNSLIAPNIAPNINKIGSFLPYNGFYFLLFNFLKTPIIATSANLGGEAIITKREEIEKKLPFIDFIVDYNRDIINAIDDSIVQIINKDIFILRLARGYAPKEIILDRKIDKKFLCVGANSKSSISLVFENKVIISPYIGDLENIESFDFFKQTIKTFERFYDFKPDIIVCDKHNGYFSSKFAKDLAKKEGLELIEVQHHLAHLYSVKAEYNLKDKNYLGFIFDGTGVGDDGKLWGGEVFVKEKRKYYFKPIKLLGGEIAIKEPRRVALALLFEKYSLEEILKLNLPTIKAFSRSEIELLYLMWKRELNTIDTSSAGRLFDAISSIAGVIQKITFEGESGIKSEVEVESLKELNGFNYNIDNGEIEIYFDFFDKNLIRKFYATTIIIILDIAKKENLPIILSGGVFQNKVLLKNLIYHLKKEKIRYYINKTIPTNDGGISVGQAWYILTELGLI